MEMLLLLLHTSVGTLVSKNNRPHVTLTLWQDTRCDHISSLDPMFWNSVGWGRGRRRRGKEHSSLFTFSHIGWAQTTAYLALKTHCQQDTLTFKELPFGVGGRYSFRREGKEDRKEGDEGGKERVNKLSAFLYGVVSQLWPQEKTERL